MIENLKNDFIMIGKKQIPVRIMEIDHTKLSFYPENPRVYSALNSDGTIPSQDVIETHMKNLEHVRKLALDIKNNGGLMEEIIVRDGDYVVLEGNSRLAAYRILHESNPVQWNKIKCKILPRDIDDSLIFKLIGQYHIKGKKPWDAFEQASYVYRRKEQTKAPIEYLAEELGFNKSTINNMIDAVSMMKEHNEYNNRHYSYYLEYVKNGNIKKYRETLPDLDNTIAQQIKSDEIKEAEDIRKLGQIAKVKSKDSKKLINKIANKEISLYDAYDEMESSGKLDSGLNKLKAFREYINKDNFVNNIKSNADSYKESVYEMKRIIKQLQKILEKLEGENG